MRYPKSLSPSALFLWESDREEYYIKYLSDNRSSWDAQSQPASVGSAFDAYVKAHLHKDLFGHDGDGEYDVEQLLETQVEEQCRAWARRAGLYAFERYFACGCYQELRAELEKSEEPPRFEFKLTGDVQGIPLVGKPDLWYKLGVHVIYDWKVEGFCSKSAVSPKKFYKSCRDTWVPGDLIKATRGGGEAKPHKKYVEVEHHGQKIGQHWLEETNRKWADQIAIYSWLMGMQVGDEETITGIDQLCCKPTPVEEGDQWPLIRVAQHRCRISTSHQEALMARLHDCWDTIHSGHIFSDMTEEESKARCEVLDMEAPELDDPDGLWAMVNERQYRG